MTSSPPKPRRVVIVEDDLPFLELQRELLEHEGYKVYTLTAADKAHRLTRELRPDVLVLDLRLPGDVEMDEAGWHVLDQHVLDPETRHIPVIVASGAVNSIEARRPALTPRDSIRVLLKPYTLDQLLEELSTVVPWGRSSLAELVPDSLRPLTPRQREIAALIAGGCTNQQIAERLVLEVGTVANHVAQILDRLGVANRAQVAVWAAMHGLIVAAAPSSGD
jgi:two-component system nitrate/nitrite response regulator NarL